MGRIRVRLAMAAGVLAMWSVTPAALTQVRFGLPPAQEIAAGQSYRAPKIGEAYARKLAAQPDFQGQWIGTGSGFDPANYHEAYEIAPSAVFSSSPGSYLTNIPYKPEYLKQYKDVIADSVAGKDHDTFALCKPFGMPRFTRGPAGFDILQSPDLIVLHDSYGNETRRIFLDGRPHPSPLGAEDSDARTYTGHSTGHWEGDILVVETVNISAGVYDDTLAPHSDQIHMIERFRLMGKDLLESKMVIEDPVMFVRPWSVTRYYRRILMSALQNQPGSLVDPADRKYRFHNLLDHPCETTIDMSKGYQSLILPQEIESRQNAPAK